MIKGADEYSPGMMRFIEASRMVDERIAECGKEGHRSPIPEKKRCGYCFQQLIYHTPETDEILKGRQKLPLIHQPMDAPLILKGQEEEISQQKFWDKLKGIEELMKMDNLFQ